MRKAVEEYLENSGCRIVRQPAEPAPCTFEDLVDGFLVHVLRLDGESYRRAFWREAYRNGHTIGHVPRTFEAFFRRNARTFEEKVSLLLGVAALFGAYAVATLLYRRLSLLVRRLRRPTYYERERGGPQTPHAEPAADLRRDPLCAPHRARLAGVRCPFRVAPRGPRVLRRQRPHPRRAGADRGTQGRHQAPAAARGARPLREILHDHALQGDGEALPPGVRLGRARAPGDAPARTGYRRSGIYSNVRTWDNRFWQFTYAHTRRPLARVYARAGSRRLHCRSVHGTRPRWPHGRDAGQAGRLPRSCENDTGGVRGDAHLARGCACAAAGPKLHSRARRGIRAQARPSAHSAEGHQLARQTTGRLTPPPPNLIEPKSFLENTMRPRLNSVHKSSFPTLFTVSIVERRMFSPATAREDTRPLPLRAPA